MDAQVIAFTSAAAELTIAAGANTHTHDSAGGVVWSGADGVGRTLGGRSPPPDNLLSAFEGK